MEEAREGEGEEEQFELKEIVWAKIIGYPWWPARVTQTPSPRTSTYRVDFFHDHSHAFLASGKIAKYEHMRCHFDLHRHINKGLRKAIGEADRSLTEQAASCAPSRLPPAAVEDPPLQQKQLLESPQTPTPLQENNNHPSLIQQHPQPEEISQQSDSEQEQLPLSHLTYSREEREKYVAVLLKKYRLLTTPKLPEQLPSRPCPKPIIAPKRKPAGGRKGDQKSKMINKAPFQQHTFVQSLTRKLYSLLRGKEGLSRLQRKEISSSLSREVVGGGVEEMGGLFKWVAISPACTIANFYENWGCLQGEKEKSSNMTTEE